MASVIGQLEIQLLANIARLQTDMDKATRTVGGAMGSINRFIGNTQNALLGLGVGLSFGALIGQANKAIDVLAKLDDMAQKTGSSVENLSRLQKVAVQFGQDFGAVDIAIGKLAKGLAGIDDAGGKTTKALNAIGISQQFVKTNDPSQVLVEVAKKLQGYQDGASKAALATDLFGKAGIELLPFLNDAAENIDKFTGASAEAAAKSAKLKDDLGGLKVGFDSLVESVTIGMLPTLDRFIGKLNQIVQFKSIFSSVGGIDVKDYDKEIAKREKGLNALNKSKEALSKPTTANKINDFLFGDVKDLNVQITIYDDEIKSLKNLKAARDAVKASPYQSPNGDKPKLEYTSLETNKPTAKTKTDADAIRKHKEDNANKLYAIEKELSEIISDREFKHLKAVRETTDKNYKIKEDNANKFYALEKELSDTISEREFKHLKAVREIKEDTAKDQLKAQQDLAKDINKSLTDALLRGFESGKGFAKNFRDTLINMFKTLILRPTIEAILKPLTDGVSGLLSGGVGKLLSGGASAAGGGIFGGASNLLSVGKSIYSGFSSSLSSNIGGLVANLSPKLGSAIAGKMLGSAAGLGPTVAGSATGIGSITGGIGSLGSAISTALPYIGLAIGAFTLIKGLIGGGKKSYQNGNFSSSYQDGALTQTGATTNSRGALATGALPAINELTETFATRLGTLFKTFGLSDKQNFTTMVKFGKQLQARFISNSAAGGGAGVDNWTTNLGSDKEAGMAKFIANVLGGGLQQAIVTSSLSEGIKGLFNGLTDQAQIVNMINATTTLQGAQKELADKFGLTVDMAGKVASASGRAGDALGEFVKALSTVAMSGSTIGAQLVKSKDKLFGDFNTVFGDVITEAVLSTVSKQVEIPASRQQGGAYNGVGNQNQGFYGYSLSNMPQQAVKQFQTVTEQVTTFITRIASRNLQLPKTIADYDDLLKNIPKASEAGQKMFADVFSLRDQFIAKINAENGLKGNLRGGLSSVVSDAEKQKMLNEDLATLFGELKMTVPATIQELINAGKNALAQLNLGTATEATYNLAAAFPTLVDAFKTAADGAKGLAEQAKSLSDSLNPLRDESAFKTLFDFNFYKGIAGNYGNEFANRFTDGAKVTYGASNNTSVAMANNVVPINNTTISSSDPNMLNAMNVLISKVNALQTELVSIKANTKSSADTLIRVSPEGNSIQTKAAA